MDYRVLFEESNREVEERFDLASCRIREIAAGEICQEMSESIREYFLRTAQFAVMVLETAEELRSTELRATERTVLEERNRRLYEDVTGEAYEHSFANPDYAVARLGEKLGLYLSFLYTEMRGMIRYAYECRYTELTVCMEIFLEIYCMMEDAVNGDDPVGEEELAASVKDALYYYVSDYSDLFLDARVAASLDPRYSIIRDIVMESDLSRTDYLYYYGDYVTEDELKTSAYVASLPQETIDLMANTYIDGYYKGFGFPRRIHCKVFAFRKYTVNVRSAVLRCVGPTDEFVSAAGSRGQFVSVAYRYVYRRCLRPFQRKPCTL